MNEKAGPRHITAADLKADKVTGDDRTTLERLADFTRRVLRVSHEDLKAREQGEAE